MFEPDKKLKTIKSRKIKMAIVGCGRIFQKHLDAVKFHENDIELAAVCDEDEVRVTKAAEENGCLAFTSLSSLLDDCELDLKALLG